MVDKKKTFYGLSVVAHYRDLDVLLHAAQRGTEDGKASSTRILLCKERRK